jgi:MHS family proline/betaine transporter-like MFS transporter
MSAIRRYSSRLQYAILATIMGNMLQWFDFSLFGMMLPLFMELFFPNKDASFFFVFFAIGGMARPIGGLVFGYLGDTSGRKAALVRTILLMTIPILLVALLPSYKNIGVMSGVLLAGLYIFQGFCVGGEFPGSIVFLEETAPAGQRGFIGSWSYFGVILGMFLVSVDIYELNHRMSPENLVNWGWRLPFYMGAAIGVVGILMRVFLHETPVFKEAQLIGHLVKKPLLDTLRKHKRILLKGLGIYILDAVGFNVILIFSSYYYFEHHHLSMVQAFKINVLSVFFILILIPIMGKFGNWIGNHRLAKAASICMFLFAYPLYLLIGTNAILAIFIGQTLLLFFLAAYVCNMPVILFQLYPTEVRYTCVGIAINFSVAIFGCTAPFVTHYIIKLSNHPSVPGIYLMLAGLVAFLILRTIKSTGGTIVPQE